MKHGCCADRACTPETCMELPKGKTCADCLFIVHCKRIYGVKTENTSCDFFPRRFKSRAVGGAS